LKQLLVFILLIICLTAYSQQNGLDLLGDKKEIELKFKLENGLIILPVFYNNFLPLNFIFDTGAEHTILFRKELNDLMGLTYERRIQIRGSDLQDSIYALITRKVPIIINNNIKVKRDLVVLEEDRLQMDEIAGYQVDGILGSSFFKNLVVEINFEKKKIKLTHPNHFSSDELIGFSKVPMEIISNKPYISGETFFNGTSQDQKLLLDSGSSLAFLLHYQADSTSFLPEAVVAGKLGRGLGGDLTGLMGKIDALKLDQFSFNEVITHFQEISNSSIDSVNLIRTGLIGTPILSRFTVCIDYLRRELFLKPNKNYSKEFKYDRSGLSLIAYGPNFNKFYVTNVLANSPAGEADIRFGDIITRIGIWSTRWYSLEKITNKLKGDEGDLIKFTLQRGGEKIKRKFKLRDQFAKKAQNRE